MFFYNYFVLFRSKIPRKTLSFIPTINKSSYNIGDPDNLNNAASRNGDQVAILDGHSVTFKARRPSSTNSSAVEQVMKIAKIIVIL